MRASGDSPVAGGPDSGADIDSPTGRPAANRVSSLTGLRALAALLIVGTHAAFGTGHLDDGYLGQLYAR
ncbi:MAG: hypothetical protein WBV64_11415, partial [Mycobacterium sp.]